MPKKVADFRHAYLRRRLSAPILRDLYLTCVLPSLEYGLLSWCGLGRSNFQQLEHLHRHAVHLICSNGARDQVDHNCNILLARAGLSSLRTRLDFRLAVFAHRLIHELVPDYILMETEHWFTNDLPERSKSLRHPPAVYLPWPRKRAVAGSPVYVCLSLWNSLPVNLRSGSTSDLKVYFDLH